MPQVARSLDIAAPPSAVWAWFTTPDNLRRWLAPNLDIDLREGGSYRLQGPDGTWISGVVLELVPEGRLVLSWLEEDAGWVHPGRLVVELLAVPAGTRVTLVHDGFAGIGKAGWQSTMQAYERGADKHLVLQRLAALAVREEQPAEAR
ncbi:MAG: SRPBCC domain-containing protein [Microlunatus sp.]|nr:SRPBCC domain-containing protein [Microlunatus sp.]